MNKEKKIKQQRRRRIIFYIAIFTVCLTAGYKIGKIGMPKPVKAEEAAFVIGENQPEKTLKSNGFSD